MFYLHFFPTIFQELQMLSYENLLCAVGGGFFINVFVFKF